MDIRQLRKFVRLHDKKRKLEEELKEVKAAISEMQPEVLEYLQENGIQNIDVQMIMSYLIQYKEIKQ